MTADVAGQRVVVVHLLGYKQTSGHGNPMKRRRSMRRHSTGTSVDGRLALYSIVIAYGETRFSRQRTTSAVQPV